jgi:hypothetical protein
MYNSSRKKDDMSWQKFLITVILLVISASAFVAGFLESGISDNMAKFKREAEEIERTAERITLMSQFITDNDLSLVQTIHALDSEIFLFDLEYQGNNASYTINQRNIAINRLAFLLVNLQSLYEQIISMQIFRHFEIDQKLSDFTIATEAEDGYDLVVTKAYWDYLVSNWNVPYAVETAQQFYGYFATFDRLQDCICKPLNPVSGDESFLQFRMLPDQVIDILLFDQARQLNIEANHKLVESEELESQANRISLGVSIVTVAVVISSAMANRVSELIAEEEFAEIKATLKKDETLLIKRKDFISIPVLIIAATLPVFGILFPIIL